MRSLFALVLALIAVPASAETFRHTTIVDPPALSEPTVLGIELSIDLQEEGGFRIVTETGFAIPFETDVVDRDLMPLATIATVPNAADTLPKTNVQMIRGDGAFQPVTARTHVFRFTFTKDITPGELELSLESGRINALRVRGGLTEGTMKSLFAGPAYGGTSAQLSGERVRIIEVEIDTEGVLKIDTIRLLDTPRMLFFRAVPGKAYSLLSGGYGAATVSFPNYPSMYGQHNPARLASIGRPVVLTTDPDDNDGIASAADNCPDRWNYDQRDQDNDGTGDACDPCPTIANGEDADLNGRCDGLEDPDEDGVVTVRDNCPATLNRLQEDEDADGIGNACDDTDDRFSANKPWLLWSGIAVVILALMGVAGLALRKR